MKVFIGILALLALALLALSMIEIGPTLPYQHTHSELAKSCGSSLETFERVYARLQKGKAKASVGRCELSSDNSGVVMLRVEEKSEALR